MNFVESEIMKIKYNLVTIQFKIALSEVSKRTFAYEQAIKSFRALQDLGIVEVEYFDNREIEKKVELENEQ